MEIQKLKTMNYSKLLSGQDDKTKWGDIEEQGDPETIHIEARFLSAWRDI